MCVHSGDAAGWVDDALCMCVCCVPHSHICHVSHSSCWTEFIAHINFRQTENRTIRTPADQHDFTSSHAKGERENDFSKWKKGGTQGMRRIYVAAELTSNNRNMDWTDSRSSEDVGWSSRNANFNQSILMTKHEMWSVIQLMGNHKISPYGM